MTVFLTEEKFLIDCLKENMYNLVDKLFNKLVKALKKYVGTFLVACKVNCAE